MQHPILIFTATMSGTAEMVADEVSSALVKAGYATRVFRMEKVTRAMLEQRSLFLVCSSSYGTGEVPENGKAFLELLETGRPDLSHAKYGVIALGDKTYSASFCGGGAKLDEALRNCGAEPLVQRLEVDARSGTYPEEAALNWLQGFVKALESLELA